MGVLVLFSSRILNISNYLLIFCKMSISFLLSLFIFFPFLTFFNFFTSEFCPFLLFFTCLCALFCVFFLFFRTESVKVSSCPIRLVHPYSTPINRASLTIFFISTKVNGFYILRSNSVRSYTVAFLFISCIFYISAFIMNTFSRL